MIIFTTIVSDISSLSKKERLVFKEEVKSRCTQCKIDKKLDEFHKCSRNRDYIPSL